MDKFGQEFLNGVITMNKQLTSSMVVGMAQGMDPDGIPAKIAGHCAFCGAVIDPGDLVVPFSANAGFMDDLSLAARGSDMTCGYCVHHISAEGLRITSHGVFGVNSGVKPFRKWADVRAGLLAPPEGPFVMLYATANNQHMAWRAPVNYSRELFYVRVGLRDLKIRRQYLVEAVAVCERMAVKLYGGKEGSAAKKTLPNPFGGLSPDLKDIKHADLSRASPFANSKYQHLSEDQNYMKDLNFMQGLTLGETWALRFVLTPNAGQQTDEE